MNIHRDYNDCPQNNKQNLCVTFGTIMVKILMAQTPTDLSWVMNMDVENDLYRQTNQNYPVILGIFIQSSQSICDSELTFTQHWANP